jgi:hypothetical protein
MERVISERTRPEKRSMGEADSHDSAFLSPMAGSKNTENKTSNRLTIGSPR